MIQVVKLQLRMKEPKAPFLFLYKQSPELYYENLYRELWEVCREYSVDNYSIYKLERDDPESHKIQLVKAFVEKWNTMARQAFQVFVFEDFWRLTPQSQNACLKFIEEPWDYNIIILTAPSKKGILDTILSRVQVYSENTFTQLSENPFFISLIKSALEWNKEGLIRYFFSKKLEKQEYIDFLKTLLIYITSNWSHLHLHQKLHDDIVGIESNNFIARSIVDIYILEI